MTVDASCESCRTNCPNGAAGDVFCADVQFHDGLDSICTCATDNSVSVNVISSYRRPGAAVEGAVVTPAGNSNHHAGHAIDVNVLYTDAGGAAQTCNSACLAGTLPQPVADFITCVKNAGLRWGGDFADRDVVDFVDNLTEGCPTNCPQEFLDRRDRVQTSGECPEGQSCNETTGQCEANAVCPPPGATPAPSPDASTSLRTAPLGGAGSGVHAAGGSGALPHGGNPSAARGTASLRVTCDCDGDGIYDVDTWTNYECPGNRCFGLATVPCDSPSFASDLAEFPAEAVADVKRQVMESEVCGHCPPLESLCRC
jgi:hypothetical protein